MASTALIADQVTQAAYASVKKLTETAAAIARAGQALEQLQAKLEARIENLEKRLADVESGVKEVSAALPRDKAGKPLKLQNIKNWPRYRGTVGRLSGEVSLDPVT